MPTSFTPSTRLQIATSTSSIGVRAATRCPLPGCPSPSPSTGGNAPRFTFGRGFAIGDFDISRDRREIIFDRTREESDIVLFDLIDR